MHMKSKGTTSTKSTSATSKSASSPCTGGSWRQRVCRWGVHPLSPSLMQVCGVVVVLGVLVHSVVSEPPPPPPGQVGVPAPPSRPKVFKNPQELKSYLKSLNDYYAVVGRPRFGKRAGPTFLERRLSEREKLQEEALYRLFQRFIDRIYEEARAEAAAMGGGSLTYQAVANRPAAAAASRAADLYRDFDDYY